jgi:type I restriction enzyme, S subunit
MANEGAFAPVAELGALPLGWRWMRLRDLIDRDRGICYGIVQPGRHDPNGVPMVNSQDVVGGRVAESIEFRVSPSLHTRYRRSTISGGEILITLVGANFGQVAVAPARLAGSNCSRAVGILPVVESPEYVMFCLRSPLARRFMDNWANTTAQPTFNLKDVASLPIPFPPTLEREAIASVLGALDDKIELNRQTTAALEAVAQALFNSWFVDFEPVLANSTGLDSDASDTRRLFPSSFESSDIGDIPSGWAAKSVSELAVIGGGGTPNTTVHAYWASGTHAWATPKDLSALSTPVLLETERCITDAGLSVIASGLLPTGTVLVSSRAPIGYLAITEIPVAINQGFIAMTARDDVSNLFLLFWARAAHEEIVSRANGSTFLEISKANFRPIRVVTPPPQVMRAFDQKVRPLYERIVLCEQESRTLIAIRDMLLPKLLLGVVRIRDAERIVGHVT